MPPDEFALQCSREIEAQGADKRLLAATRDLHRAIGAYNYFYHFSWAGLPVLQCPQDIVQMQELVWCIQPDLIIETGIARGGSLMLYASLLTLNATCGGPQDAKVLGIDIDIREHNRAKIEAHPLFKRISMIEGSSISREVIDKVKAIARGKARVIVSLDSNHSHDHVLAEMEAYAPLTSVGSYCVVFDTLVDELPAEDYRNRPWGAGNNPKTAAREFLKSHPEFEIDKSIQYKLLMTAAPDGFLKRIR